MILKEYRSEGCAVLAELFYNTVHSVNLRDYSEEQVCAWADGHVDLEKWDQSFREHHTVVAWEKDVITGFGDMAEELPQQSVMSWRKAPAGGSLQFMPPSQPVRFLKKEASVLLIM